MQPESQTTGEAPRRILLLNQAFHPDVVATAQVLTDLAVELARRGHEVTVIAGRRGYDNPSQVYPGRETWRGIRIERIGALALGKGARWRRAANFASFLAACALRMARLPRQDLVVALTSPPLIALLAALWTRLRGGRYAYWIMDLNPDEAVAAGWLRPGSPAERLLAAVSRFCLRAANPVVALDRFMARRILDKGVPPNRVVVRPLWQHDDHVRFDPAGRARFRAAHGLEGRWVVMYAGNHSPCHPLDTLLEAARRMAADPGFAFCFVGGGSQWPRVAAFRESHRLDNILCLPYQPLDQLAASLSAADLHTVVIGDPFVGLVHPCKIYNILAVGAPLLCIGPGENHVADMTGGPAAGAAYFARHGDAAAVEAAIRASRDAGRPGHPGRPELSKAEALPRLIEALMAASSR